MKRRLTDLTAFKKLPLWLGLATLVALIYLAAAWFGAGHVGFPLDDAWIHQTYARNLGQRGEFAFTPGVPSTGSTSPLWTVLLSIGYFLRIPYKLWTYSLGILSLGLSGFSMARLSQRLFPDRLWLGPVIGLALVMEWHLIWASVSGMETILFVWLSILLVERYANLALSAPPTPEKPAEASTPKTPGGHYFQLGLIGGLLTLVRPEGIGLMGLIGLHIILTAFLKTNSSPAHPLTCPPAHLPTRLLMFSAGFLLPVLPYLAFNYSVTGLPLPNTFYAKQQEYAVLLSHLNLLQRWFSVMGVTLIGAQALLIPGVIKAFGEIIKKRDSFLGLIALWWFSYLTLYAIRLPVTYQHGRYEIPTIPWLLLLSIWGIAFLLHPNHRRLWIRVVSKAWLASSMAAFLIFIALGAQGYAGDVEFIETEMVQTAYWLRENTEPDTLIAAHDIGAIGYFAERPLVDLAGLITPEVIPFIRDEAALLAFSQKQGAGYLVTFPNWYPTISASLFQVYSTNSSWAIEAGYDNMSVYQLEIRD